MDDVLPFGRHQGYTVREIVKDRPQYISWLMNNTGLKFSKTVTKHTACTVKWPGRPLTMPGSFFDVLSDQDDWWNDDIPF